MVPFVRVWGQRTTKIGLQAEMRSLLLNNYVLEMKYLRLPNIGKFILASTVM